MIASLSCLERFPQSLVISIRLARTSLVAGSTLHHAVYKFDLALSSFLNFQFQQKLLAVKANYLNLSMNQM
jgi:hypothetical protein